ncbi:MAG: NAD(P)H-hydrate dehydratase [Bacteroidetes bacterium]|nr:NAD(P)H-hydrate dehydratase [Bacteroidota bacterium]
MAATTSARILLTPHPGEFKRLAGEWHDDFEKLAKQRDFAVKFNVYLLLKGKNTSIACPDGKMYFNPTGNAGMAKGGSGDVLTGLLTGILASGYSPRETCILGAWLHGCAGDMAAKALSQEAMKAGDLVEHLGAAWQLLKEFQG